MNNRLTLAIVAVDKLLTNLANSDFVENAGGLAMNELRQYRLDMIGDVFATFEGRLMSEAETTEVINA